MIEMRSRAKYALARIADALVAPLGLLVGRRGPVPAHPRVLVVRCDHIGDGVMATSVLRPLRDALDPERLDVLTAPWLAPIFDGHQAVDRVITYATPWWLAARGASHMAAWMALPRVISRLRAQRYDIAIDLRGDLRQIFFFLLLGGALDRVSSDRTGGRRLLTKVWPYEAPRHEVEKDMAVAALVGARGTPALDVPTDPALPDSIATRLREVAGPAGVLVMAVGSREPSRGWPPADAAALAAMAWTQLGLGTVVLGGPGDRQDAETIVQLAGVPVTSLVGATTLRQTVAIFAAATVAVCTDSGPMHLAAAAGVPVVALFGRGDPRQSRPWSDRAVVLSAGAPCGCRHPTCDFVAGPGRCMATHTPDTVLAAVAAAMATSVT